MLVGLKNFTNEDNGINEFNGIEPLILAFVLDAIIG